MPEKFYAKGPGNEGYIHNMEVVAFHDLNEDNIFQIAMHRTEEGRYYLYCATFAGMGVTILDVTDAANPKYIQKLGLVDPEQYPTTRSPKIQIAEGLMIVAMSSGGGVKINRMEESKTVNYQNGIQIWDLREDPENPKYLGYWDNGVPGGIGVHRFMYNGGPYVHLSSDCRGFEGMIYRIIDISDPANPVEAGKWWLAEQYVDGILGASYDPTSPHNPAFMDKGHLHGPPFVVGDIAYCGYSGAGLCVLDVSDITRPKLIGQLGLQPPLLGRACGQPLPHRPALARAGLCGGDQRGRALRLDEQGKDQ